MPYARRQKRPIPTISSPSQQFELNDYSLGMNNYLSNDKFPFKNGSSNLWRLAQDARIPVLGEYETRKGFDYYSDPIGQTLAANRPGTTSPTDQDISETTWAAQKFTATANNYLTRLDIRIKNSAAATGTVMVELWTNNAGSPGTLLSRSSIAGSSPSAAYGYWSAYFPDAPSITSGTDYWIVSYIQLYGANAYKWSTSTTAATAKISTDRGATWSSTSFELNFRQYGSTIGGVKGMYRAYKSDGTKVTLLAQGTALYSVDDVTGALTVIKSGLSSSATNYRFDIFGDVVYYVNGYDGIRKWDFTTESQVTADNYTLLKAWKGLLWVGGGADPNAIKYSNFGLPEVFTSTDLLYADVPKNGDPPVAFMPLNGLFFVFTRNNKFVISGDNNETFRIDEAPDQKGTYTQETVCADKNHMFYLSDDGVYKSSGSEPQLMSESIYEDIRGMSTKPGCCIAVNKGRLYLWYASPGMATNDRCWVWNLNFGNGSQECLESSDTGAYVARVAAGFQDGDNMIVGSSRVGAAYYQELENNDYTNLGADLNFDLRTHYMNYGRPSQLHEIRYWNPRFRTSTTNNGVQCQYSYDLNATSNLVSEIDVQGSGYQWGAAGTIWGSFVWGVNAEVQGQLTVPGEFRRIQLRYSHSATRQKVTFLGHSLQVMTRRMR